MTTSAAKKKFPDGTSPRLVYIVPLFETANFRTYLGIFKTHLNPKIGSKYGFKWVSLQDSTKDLYLVTTPFEWWTVGQSLVTQPQSNRVEVECRRPTRWPGERVKKTLQGWGRKPFLNLRQGILQISNVTFILQALFSNSCTSNLVPFSTKVL